jgi:hypothetical protein
MKSLFRHQFLDLTWGATDLDAASEYWLQLYQEAATRQGFSATPELDLEIRLSGFPRQQGEVLRTELERRVSDSDADHYDVILKDRDTLVLSSAGPAGKRRPPPGLGLPVLAGALVDGLAAEIRFRTIGHVGEFLRFGRVSACLVVVGELRGGRLFVKAFWRSGATGLEDTMYRSEQSRDESPLLAGLQEFRKTGEVREDLAGRFFKPSSVDRRTKWLLNLFYTPLDGPPRLTRLLMRVALFAVLLAPFAWMIRQAVEDDELLWLVPVIMFGWLPMILLGLFVYIEWKLLFIGYRGLRELSARQHEESRPFHTLAPPEAAAFANDPNVRKYTAELAEAGFALQGDVAQTIAGDVTIVYRIFLVPDGVTYMILICVQFVEVRPEKRHYSWPVSVMFEAQTFFAQGGRVDSVSAGYEYWQPPLDANTMIRRDSETKHPIEFCRAHIAEAQAFAGEKGLTAIRHERLEDQVRRQEAIRDEERQHYHDHPYSWWDHLRWYLQWPRKQQRG